MFRLFKKVPKIDAPKILDEIEKEVYAVLKPFGFRKHGRTLHRFVDGDISQVVNFQLGMAYREETHLLWVNIGIRVPECFQRSFQAEENPKKYYHEYECNLRSRLGKVEGKEETTYNLRKPTEPIISDILRQLQDVVLPVFDIMCSREAILENRRKYPEFDTMYRSMILIEESMIYGRQGNYEKAEQLFREYYYNVVKEIAQTEKNGHFMGHLKMLDKLAKDLDIMKVVHDIADVEAVFCFNGTRRNPVSDGYRPDHLIKDDYLTTGIHHYYDVKEVAPDGRAIGTITFLTPEAYPHCLQVGQKIKIQEGERVVGEAIIVTILNPILTKEEKRVK